MKERVARAVAAVLAAPLFFGLNTIASPVEPRAEHRMVSRRGACKPGYRLKHAEALPTYAWVTPHPGAEPTPITKQLQDVHTCVPQFVECAGGPGGCVTQYHTSSYKWLSTLAPCYGGMCTITDYNQPMTVGGYHTFDVETATCHHQGHCVYGQGLQTYVAAPTSFPYTIPVDHFYVCPWSGYYDFHHSRKGLGVFPVDIRQCRSDVCQVYPGQFDTEQYQQPYVEQYPIDIQTYCPTNTALHYRHGGDIDITININNAPTYLSTRVHGHRTKTRTITRTRTTTLPGTTETITTTSTTTATAGPGIQFVLAADIVVTTRRRMVKRADGRSYVAVSSGIASLVSTCSDATIFTLIGGVLYAGSGVVVASSQDITAGSGKMTIGSAGPGSETTAFSFKNGVTLAWNNARFLTDREALFCADTTGQLFVQYNDNIACPGSSVPIMLLRVSVDSAECQASSSSSSSGSSSTSASNTISATNTGTTSSTSASNTISATNTDTSSSTDTFTGQSISNPTFPSDSTDTTQSTSSDTSSTSATNTSGPTGPSSTSASTTSSGSNSSSSGSGSGSSTSSSSSSPTSTSSTSGSSSNTAATTTTSTSSGTSSGSSSGSGTSTSTSATSTSSAVCTNLLTIGSINLCISGGGNPGALGACVSASLSVAQAQICINNCQPNLLTTAAGIQACIDAAGSAGCSLFNTGPNANQQLANLCLSLGGNPCSQQQLLTLSTTDALTRLALCTPFLSASLSTCAVNNQLSPAQILECILSNGASTTGIIPTGTGVLNTLLNCQNQFTNSVLAQLCVNLNGGNPCANTNSILTLGQTDPQGAQTALNACVNLGQLTGVGGTVDARSCVNLNPLSLVTCLQGLGGSGTSSSATSTPTLSLEQICSNTLGITSPDLLQLCITLGGTDPCTNSALVGLANDPNAQKARLTVCLANNQLLSLGVCLTGLNLLDIPGCISRGGADPSSSSTSSSATSTPSPTVAELCNTILGSTNSPLQAACVAAGGVDPCTRAGLLTIAVDSQLSTIIGLCALNGRLTNAVALTACAASRLVPLFDLRTCVQNAPA